jgi:hypothetical protein
MYVGPFQISLDTLLGVAPMLGHCLEDRSDIRDQQDWSLVQWLQAHTAVRLRDVSQHHLFIVAPLDVLVTQNDQGKQFHIIEINGVGIGGLTCLTGQAVSAVLDNLRQFAEEVLSPDALVLVASSGKEQDDNPRLNKLIHEKVLYAEALKRGFDYAGRPARVLTLTQLLQDHTPLHNGQPTIVLGYTKEFLAHLQTDDAGRLRLFGRLVNAALNDRFCLNVLHEFGPRVDLNEFLPLNRCFLAGADKGVAYELLNDFLARSPRRCMPGRIQSVRVHNRPQLIATVLDWVRRGRKTVMKPQGTGLGHGIEFFLSRTEPAESIAARIDASLAQVAQQYGLKGGAFPYTICEFLDGCTLEDRDHPLHGHKYELRIVVYRDGMHLRAFPSIVKIASAAYDPDHPTPLSLINNITTSAQATHRPGLEFMLPLANRETLELLGLSLEELLELCEAATSFVRDMLDRVQDEPALFGLPAVAKTAAR